MTRRELGSFAFVSTVILGVTGGVLGLLIASGTDGTMLDIVGSGVIAATA